MTPTGRVTMPSVTPFSMDASMACCAEGDEVLEVAAATFAQWYDMVHLLDRNRATLLETFLAQGMCCDISITDAFPRPVISLGRISITLIAVVVFHDLLCMLLAVPAICQVRTAGIRAGPFRFPWHCYLQDGKRKPSQLFIPARASSIISCYQFTTWGCSLLFTHDFLFILPMVQQSSRAFQSFSLHSVQS